MAKAEDRTPEWRDPVIEAYKRDIDRTLLRESLKCTPQQRMQSLQKMQELADELQRGMQKAKTKP
jgi:hypothetical protein